MIDRLFEFVRDLVGDDDARPAADDQAILLAAAALMLEVARSDTQHQDVELGKIESILEDSFEVPRGEVSALISAASSRVEAAHALYQFTQLINARFSYTDKAKLVAAMWMVAFADGHIEAIEDHIIRRVSGLLHLAHEDFIRLKHQARGRHEGQG